MNKSIGRAMVFILLLFVNKGVTQSGSLILEDDFLQNSKVFLVEELPQKRNFFNTRIAKYKFGNYTLTEGRHNWGNTSTQKQTKNGNQVINRSKFKLTIGNTDNITSSAKVISESKELIFDNETFFEQLFPALGTTIPSVEKLNKELSGILTINSVANSKWHFLVKKKINKEEGNSFEMNLNKGERIITIVVANKATEDGLIACGFEFIENYQSLAALYVGLPNKTIRFRNDLDAETEIILATMMACLMVEYPSPSIFTNSY